MPFRVPGIQNVQTVAAATGAYYPTALALLRDGTVWAWGNNGDGQLGNGTFGGPSMVPVAVPGLNDVKAISANWHLLAVKQDGTVWAWGSNSNGQLGLGTTTPAAVPTPIPGLTNVQSITAAARRSFAVKTDGSVMAWGSGAWDALGDGSWRDFNQLTPQVVPGLSNAVEVVFGFSHGLARRLDGSVWAWGMGGSQMGSIAYGALPAPLPGLGPMRQISATDGSSALLSQDGLLYMGGLNALGQLGDGTFAQHSDFVLAINPEARGFLDLAPLTSKSVPAKYVPPFLVKAERQGELSALSLRADVHGMLGNDVSRSARATVGYKLYVVAYVGAQNILNWYRLDAQHNWGVLSWPLAEFMSGVALSSKTDSVILQIFDAVDLSLLTGSHIYVGYGIDANEMLSAGRYREIMTVAAPLTR
jgi:hypothetical protein